MSQIKRRNYFIDRSFQAKFVVIFCLIVFLASALAMGVLLHLSKGSNTVAIENTQVIVKTTADFILPLTFQTILISFILAALACILLTIAFSHKISGPLYRLTKEVDAVQSGDLTRVFKTRGADQLQKFSESLFKMTNTLRCDCADLKARYQSLKSFLESKEFVLSLQDKEEITRLMDALLEKLNYFKTS